VLAACPPKNPTFDLESPEIVLELKEWEHAK
jgi:hypothetical protein